MKLFILFFLIFTHQAFAKSKSIKDVHKKSKYKKEWGYKSVTCQLTNMSDLKISGQAIKTSHKKEKAKLKTIFTDLNTDKPKMVYPDNIPLIKIRQFGNTYWLLSPQGTFATAMFIVNDKDNWFVQQKAMSLPTGESLFYSWAGTCE